jgi:hypothetical protein
MPRQMELWTQPPPPPSIWNDLDSEQRTLLTTLLARLITQTARPDTAEQQERDHEP